MARPLTVTENGDVIFDTTNKKFGTASAGFDSGDYLSVADNNYWNIGDWKTIDCWIRVSDPGQSLTHYIVSQTEDSINAHWWLTVFSRTAVGINTVSFKIEQGSAGEHQVFVSTGVSSPPLLEFDTWHHLRLLNDGSAFTLWLNGIKQTLTVSGTGYISSTSFLGDLWIGQRDSASNNPILIDELLITNEVLTSAGVSSFTPPTAPWNPFVNTSDKLLLLHFDNSFVDDVGVSASASILDNFVLTATARADNPPMVYPYVIEYTWDDLDQDWDTWYALDSNINYDLWTVIDPQGFQFPPTVFSISAEGTGAVFGESQLNLVFDQQIKGGIIIQGSLDADSEFTHTATGTAVRQIQLDLTVDSALAAQAERLPGGSADLDTAFDLSAKAGIIHDAVSDLDTEIDLTASGRLLKFADIYIEDFAGLTATADLTLNGRSALDIQFTQQQIAGLLIEVNEPYDYTWDTLPEDLWNGFPADRWGPQGFLAFENLNISTQAGLVVEATASLSLESNLSTVGALIKDAESNLATDIQLSCLAESVRPGQSSLSSQFVLSAKAGVTIDGLDYSTYDIVSNLAANGDLILEAQADLKDNFGFNISAIAVRQDSLDLPVSFDITARAGIIHDATIDQSVVFDLDSRTGIIKDADADLSILAFQITEGISNPAIQSGQINLDTAFASVVRAGIIHDAQTALSQEINQVTRSGILFDARADLSALGFLFSDGRISDVRGSADLSSNFAITALSNVEITGQADLSILAFQLTDGRISDVRGSADLTFSFQSDFSGDLRLLESGDIFEILSENRNLLIKSETRSQTILPESRVLEVER